MQVQMDAISRPTWYLITGSTGAGKTTYARQMVETTCGVRFSIDEWMSTLYWMDLPGKDNFPWAIERVRRCEEQISAVAKDLATAGVSAILDLGFTKRDQRDAWLARARAGGIAIELHTLDLPAEVRWERVQTRNAGASETFAFEVPRAMFDAMEEMWELPSAEERATYDKA